MEPRYIPARAIPSHEIWYGVLGEARYMRLIMTTPLIIIAITAANALAVVSDAQKFVRPSARSKAKKSVMLNRLLPSTLPIARSIAPSRMAARLAAISGREVVSARNKLPTKLRESPVFAASRSPMEASQIPKATMAMLFTINTMYAFRAEILA